MRVLQINAVSGVGSTGRIAIELSDYLNRKGDEGYIAYSYGFPYEKEYKIGSFLDYKLHALGSRIFGTQAYFSKNSTRRLLDFISDIKPDVIHLHNLHGNYINLRLLLNYLSAHDIPTVITLHDCWFYTGKCTHYTIDNCFKWKDGCGACPRLRRDNPSWFFDWTKSMLLDKKRLFSDIPRLAAIGVSDWITNEARSSFLSNAKVLMRIYNWIDLSVFKPVDSSGIREKLGLKDKFVILGVASRWSNDKGLDKFLWLAQKIPSDMIILLVGQINDSVVLHEKIIHIHQTHNTTELAEYYSLADVYIHLSREETFGKTIAEALSCGTPSIVFDSTACPEIVGQNCGYIVQPNNLESVIKSVIKVKQQGKNFYSPFCIEFVNKNFNAEQNMHETIELYQSLIKHAD